jgi:hypothetical protein
MANWYIWWPFGLFYGYLVCFPVLVCCTKKNRATLHYSFCSCCFQSDLACLESKSSTLDSEHRRLTSKLTDCEKRLAGAEKELAEEKQKRKAETELLAKKLAELSKQVC